MGKKKKKNKKKRPVRLPKVDISLSRKEKKELAESLLTVGLGMWLNSGPEVLAKMVKKHIPDLLEDYNKEVDKEKPKLTLINGGKE